MWIWGYSIQCQKVHQSWSWNRETWQAANHLYLFCNVFGEIWVRCIVVFPVKHIDLHLFFTPVSNPVFRYADFAVQLHFSISVIFFCGIRQDFHDKAWDAGKRSLFRSRILQMTDASGMTVLSSFSRHWYCTLSPNTRHSLSLIWPPVWMTKLWSPIACSRYV